MLGKADLDSIDIHTLDLYATRGYPWAEWELLRREAPVYWYDRPGIEPFWAVTRYADVQAIGRDAATFVNSGRRLRLHSIEHEERMWASKGHRDRLYGWDPDEPLDLVFMDQPRHTAFRLLTARAFTPARCRAMAASLAGLAARFVGEFEAALERADGEPVDLVRELSLKLPLAAICDLMGLPTDDYLDVWRWTDSVFETESSEWALPGEARRAMRRRLRVEYFDYYEGLIAAKRARPSDDVISHLVNGEVDGRGLTQQQLHGYLNLLVLAGNETTRNATTRGILALLDHPGELERLCDDPDRWTEPAVEEILRWTSPVIQFARTAVRDTEIRGLPIRAGEVVGIWYPSANRDPAAFDRPDHFDITREPNYHLAFGHGPHFCLGANLARWELRALIGELARRGTLRQLEAVGPSVITKDLHVSVVKRQLVGVRRT
jgi:cholest-4-en-3-one 26-monooxygenase